MFQLELKQRKYKIQVYAALIYKIQNLQVEINGREANKHLNDLTHINFKIKQNTVYITVHMIVVKKK